MLRGAEERVELVTNQAANRPGLISDHRSIDDDETTGGLNDRQQIEAQRPAVDDRQVCARLRPVAQVPDHMNAYPLITEEHVTDA